MTRHQIRSSVLKNGYRLNNRWLRNQGYDWWWHSLVAINKRTGDKNPFFIEYYIINPDLGGARPILGQTPGAKRAGLRPSYAMLKAGTWAPGAARQINNFYGVDQAKAAEDRMEVRVADHFASDTRLWGSVALSEREAREHPEYMSDPGEMSWDLFAEKALSWDVGWGSSRASDWLSMFQMYWHVHGMKTRYTGTIRYNGEDFVVDPETCCGYQDKNWGRDYTVPWIWLSCNNFTSRKTGALLPMTSLDLGGGCPRVFGVPLSRRLLVAFYYEGELFEYNFSKFWSGSHEEFDVHYTDDDLVWNVRAHNRDSRIEINFSNPRKNMLCVNYENPMGKKYYSELYNGGHASGTVKLYKLLGGGQEELLDIFDGSMGAGEYGER